MVILSSFLRPEPFAPVSAEGLAAWGKDESFLLLFLSAGYGFAEGNVDRGQPKN